MKLQTKILVLLSLLTTVILLFFVSYQFIRFRESKLLYKESLKNQELVIDKVLQLNRIRFEQLINDNSGWDGMVEFVNKPDSGWADENVDFFVNSFDLSTVMVFAKNKSLLYQHSSELYPASTEFIDSQTLETLFSKNLFPHFFHLINGELYEFFGAVIVPSADADTRTTEPQGYIFIAKSWDKEVLNDLRQATNYQVEIMVRATETEMKKSGELRFVRELNDFNGNCIADLVFYGNDPVRKEKNLLLLLSVLVLFFAVASVFILMYYFRKTVIKPLRQISKTLGDKNRNVAKINDSNTLEFQQIRDLIIGYFQQETELKANYAALKELNAAKVKLFSVVAVNLKNPVEGLITLSELLEGSIERKDQETTKELLDMIGNQANQTLQLLETLFDWSKLQSDKIVCEPEELILNQVIGHVLRDLKLLYTLKNIKVETEIPEHIVVSADYKMLKTVLRNLISNAVKFTYSGGVVSVSAKIIDRFVQIEVKDNGVGISEANLAKLYHVDSAQPGIGTDNERGTGLGLIICKDFVEKHGGSISVTSTEGEGSVFMVTIPLAGISRNKV